MRKVVSAELETSPQTSISVVVPAYNEEESVGSQVEAITSTLSSRRIVHEVIVVDDGSQDRTAERAFHRGARVVRHPENKGYGAALKTGILAAHYETIVIIDADGTYPVDQIHDLVAQLQTADMVVGARIGQKVHIPVIRRPAKWVLGWLAARIAGQRIPDLNSGMRAFRREVITQYFSVLSDRFSFTTTATLALLGDGYRIVYKPIDYYRRVGKSKIRPRHFMDFTMLVLKMAMLFQPLKVFVPLASLCALIGMLALVNEPRSWGNVYNIGSAEEITIDNLAKKIKDMTRSSSEVSYVPYEQVYGQAFDDMMRRRPCLEKIEQLVGYKASTSLEETLERIIRHTRDELRL